MADIKQPKPLCCWEDCVRPGAWSNYTIAGAKVCLCSGCYQVVFRACDDSSPIRRQLPHTARFGYTVHNQLLRPNANPNLILLVVKAAAHGETADKIALSLLRTVENPIVELVPPRD